MAEIKPCPFCGSLASVRGEGSGYHVHCNNTRTCQAIGPWVNDRDAGKAVAAWNQRPEAGEGEAMRRLIRCVRAIWAGPRLELDTDASPEERREVERLWAHLQTAVMDADAILGTEGEEG